MAALGNRGRCSCPGPSISWARPGSRPWICSAKRERPWPWPRTATPAPARPPRCCLMMNMGCVLFGLTPEEALAGTTRNAARALGLARTKGTLEPGMDADLALWGIDHPAQLSLLAGLQPLSGSGSHRPARGRADRQTYRSALGDQAFSGAPAIKKSTLFRHSAIGIVYCNIYSKCQKYIPYFLRTAGQKAWFLPGSRSLRARRPVSGPLRAVIFRNIFLTTALILAWSPPVVAQHRGINGILTYHYYLIKYILTAPGNSPRIPYLTLHHFRNKLLLKVIFFENRNPETQGFHRQWLGMEKYHFRPPPNGPSRTVHS